MDVFTSRKRSDIMSRVRGKGNRSTELAMVSLFRRHRITGWRRHARVFGSPDFVFPKCRLAVFVDGCFWHCCPEHAVSPKSNAEFWAKKLDENRARDAVNSAKLRADGWTVLRFWEHEIKNDLAAVVKRVVNTIHN